MPFIYPTAYEISTIEPELVSRGLAGRLGMQLLPIRNVNAPRIRWRQRDNYTGLQHFRGLDGQPTLVQRVGENVYEYEPGVFGEYGDITETELTNRAGSADTRTTSIDVSDLVAEQDEVGVCRELDRIESSIFSILVTGTLTIKIAGPNGVMTGYSSTFPVQTYSALVDWDTSATARPLADFFNVSQLGIGKGTTFGGTATAYMNSVTANKMLTNSNAADLAGRRETGGGTFDTVEDVNKILVAKGAPRIGIYDEGYIPSGGSFTQFIPTDKVLVVGKRTSGGKLGEYVKTRNANNPGYAAGSYRYVIDRANGTNGEKRTPANIEVHRGHNGGPVLYYPSAFVVMSV